MAARSKGGGRPRSRWGPRLFAGAAPLGLVLALLTCARPCRADDAQAFELAKNPFDAGQYAEAHTRLAALLDPALPPCDGATAAGRCRIADPDLIERARTLDAASLLALKHEAEADVQIARILRQNPQYAPSPAMFPQEVIDRFTMVRGTLRAELEGILAQREREDQQKRREAQKARDADEKWIADLMKLASEQKVVEKNSRWIALVPFGVGQFQNESVALGVVFAVGEALLGGASLATVAIVNGFASTNINAKSASNATVNIEALNANIRVATTVNQVSFVGWATLTLAGVIQAQAAFVPERVTFKKRPIPPRPTVSPVAAPLPGGALLGVSGTF
jgi:hypothetical protein